MSLPLIVDHRNNAALPDKFKCRVGWEWKTWDAFSKRQQGLVERELKRGNEIDAANTGMTCREHAEPRNEFECQVCGLVKDGKQFSKNTKRNGEYICMRCVAWTETQEPGVTPTYLETGHISIEEEGAGIWSERDSDGAMNFQHDKPPHVPIADFASLGLNEGNGGQLTYNNPSTDFGAVDWSSIPAHVQEALRAIKTEDMSSSVSQAELQSESSITGGMLPHLRGQVCPGASYTSVAASELALPPHLRKPHASRHPTAPEEWTTIQCPDSVSTATTLRGARNYQNVPGVPFNAWGPDGQKYSGVKVPTASSATDEESAPSSWAENERPGQQSGWQQTVEKSTRPKGKGNWHKPKRLTASELRQPEGFMPRGVVDVSRRAFVDPKIDQQRRANYRE
ncbi:hypothetical protein DCS_05483 [Drechmeria coniospora]|uniref:Stc1 domain-containing protein n=1 Tax=Drechmeria coniospora TaxID=98403 RepID=A0A151GMX9_DRECN|nr:hypothetical protein DCS_05483 [Drechmeria coniospora]KYK58467.1 hypothetical protein DCS_05483 [Drechmeria coniospora]